MDLSITLRPVIEDSLIAEKACAAYAKGKGRADHGFNWHSYHAIAVWQTAWDQCAEQHAKYEQLLAASQKAAA